MVWRGACLPPGPVDKKVLGMIFARLFSVLRGAKFIDAPANSSDQPERASVLRAVARRGRPHCRLLVLGVMVMLCAPCRAAEDHGAEHAAHQHGQATEAAAHGGASEPNPLAIDPDLAIWTAITFGVLMCLLGQFAWPAISTALVEREERIERNIAAAAEQREAAQQLVAEQQAKLAQAADQVRELLEEARRDADYTKSQILAEAKQQADQQRERAVRDVEQAANQALKGLAETSANLAVDLAGKVIRQNVTPKQQAALVREALGTLAHGTPDKNV